MFSKYIKPEHMRHEILREKKIMKRITSAYEYGVRVHVCAHLYQTCLPAAGETSRLLHTIGTTPRHKEHIFRRNLNPVAKSYTQHTHTTMSNNIMLRQSVYARGAVLCAETVYRFLFANARIYRRHLYSHSRNMPHTYIVYSTTTIWPRHNLYKGFHRCFPERTTRTANNT